MKKSHIGNDQRGVGHHLLLFVIATIVLGVSAFTGWKIYQSQNGTDAEAASYTEIQGTEGYSISACKTYLEKSYSWSVRIQMKNMLKDEALTRTFYTIEAIPPTDQQRASKIETVTASQSSTKNVTILLNQRAFQYGGDYMGQALYMGSGPAEVAVGERISLPSPALTWEYIGMYEIPDCGAPAMKWTLLKSVPTVGAVYACKYDLSDHWRVRSKVVSKTNSLLGKVHTTQQFTVVDEFKPTDPLYPNRTTISQSVKVPKVDGEKMLVDMSSHNFPINPSEDALGTILDEDNIISRLADCEKPRKEDKYNFTRADGSLDSMCMQRMAGSLEKWRINVRSYFPEQLTGYVLSTYPEGSNFDRSKAINSVTVVADQGDKAYGSIIVDVSKGEWLGELFFQKGRGGGGAPSSISHYLPDTPQCDGSDNRTTSDSTLYDIYYGGDDGHLVITACKSSVNPDKFNFTFSRGNALEFTSALVAGLGTNKDLDIEKTDWSSDGKIVINNYYPGTNGKFDVFMKHRTESFFAEKLEVDGKRLRRCT